MDTATVETPVVEAPPAPVVESTPEPVEEAVSIADHASSFGPETAAEQAERAAANTGQFADRSPDGRRKAQSQRATPEDVAEINRLTRELRETEQRLGEKDPDAKVSPRIRTLRRQLAALKALDAPAVEAKPVVRQPESAKPAVQSAAGAFTEKEPTLEDFADKDDPYLALSRAAAAWDRRKERFEEQQAQSQQQSESQDRERITRHLDRMSAFAASKPDFEQVTAEFMSRNLTPLMKVAIVDDDNGPDVVYYLAQHPDLVDELFLQTAPTPVTNDTVATLQRRLKKEMQQQAASTGSAAPAKPAYIPPRPPNPVRTGPVKSGDEIPAEASSIADHKRYFGKR